jgi:hypothetical protein
MEGEQMKINLRMFAGGHSVTLYKDAGVTTFTADETSDVQKDDEVTLTVVLASGYEIDAFEVLAGGVTVEADDDDWVFTMGESDVAINLKTKANNLYMVTEECSASVNDAKVILHKNAKVVLTPNGVPKAINVESGGTAIAMTQAVQNLIDQGILVKI